jgi:hypothetical protein
MPGPYSRKEGNYSISSRNPSLHTNSRRNAFIKGRKHSYKTFSTRRNKIYKERNGLFTSSFISRSQKDLKTNLAYLYIYVSISSWYCMALCGAKHLFMKWNNSLSIGPMAHCCIILIPRYFNKISTGFRKKNNLPETHRTESYNSHLQTYWYEHKIDFSIINQLNGTLKIDQYRKLVSQNFFS